MKIKNKELLLLSLLCITFLFCQCIFDPSEDTENNKYTVSEPFSFSFNMDVSQQISVTVVGVSGSIDIVGVDDSEKIEIFGERMVKSDSETDAEEQLTQLEFQVRNTSQEVSIKTVEPKDKNGREYEVTYHLKIPKTCNVSVTNVNGDVDVDSLNSDVSVNVTNGNILLDDVKGNVNLNLTNGNVISKIALVNQGACIITVVNGQIQLSVPKETSAGLNAYVTNGTVSATNLMLNNVTSKQNHIQGTLGTGQGTIALTIVNGFIHISGY